MREKDDLGVSLKQMAVVVVAVMAVAMMTVMTVAVMAVVLAVAMAMAPFTKVEDSGRAGLVVEDDGFTFRRVEPRVPERHPNRDIKFALPRLDLLSYLFSPKQFAEDCHFYKNSRYCTNVGPS